MMSLPAIFNSNNVTFSLDTNKSNFITYDLNVPIRSKIFKFNNFG